MFSMLQICEVYTSLSLSTTKLFQFKVVDFFNMILTIIIILKLMFGRQNRILEDSVTVIVHHNKINLHTFDRTVSKASVTKGHLL